MAKNKEKVKDSTLLESASALAGNRTKLAALYGVRSGYLTKFDHDGFPRPWLYALRWFVRMERIEPDGLPQDEAELREVLSAVRRLYKTRRGAADPHWRAIRALLELAERAKVAKKTGPRRAGHQEP